MYRAVYSCLVDRDPKFQRQALIFVETLHRNAKVPYQNIYVHLTERGLAVEDFFRDKGVNIVPVERFGDKKYCNKIAQVDSAEIFEGDFVFLCDTDLAFLASIEGVAPPARPAVVGKTVDFSFPPLPVFAKMAQILGASLPRQVTDTLTGEPTLAGNFNGGLYGVPTAWLPNLGGRWKKWALRLLSDPRVIEALGDYGKHIDQIAFCLALHDSGYPMRRLALRDNCPTPVALPLSGAELTEFPRVIHFHDNMDRNGLLSQTGVRITDLAMDRVNRSVKNLRKIDVFQGLSKILGSKSRPIIRSLGELSLTADNITMLRGVLRTAGIERAETVLEYLCGSALHLEGLALKNYQGVDPDEGKLALARKRFPSFQFVSKAIHDLTFEPADIVLCLDLGRALVEGKDLPEFIGSLARQTRKRLIVSGFNRPWRMELNTSVQRVSIQRLLESTGDFKRIACLGQHAGLDILVAEKSVVPSIGRPIGDDKMDEETLTDALATSEFPQLLFECALVSDSIFGGFTHRLPHAFAYPWMLDRAGRSLTGRTAGVFGAGPSSLPFSLANRGARVFTVDNHLEITPASGAPQHGEQGFFDYNALHGGIESRNEALIHGMFDAHWFDVWCAVEAIGHIPARVRRHLFDVFSYTTKPGGMLLLTLDLHKRSRDLWNPRTDQSLESREDPGTLAELVSELDARAYAVIEESFLPLPQSVPVDLGFVRAVKLRDTSMDRSQGISSPHSNSDQRLDALQRELKAVYASTSWRLTAPLRGVRHLLYKIKQ